MNALSLFDGMSCGQIALNRAGFKIDNYFACEIDKYAIQVTQANYPNTQQLGDVTKVSALDLPTLDLVMGGSPCQGFSFAGKQLNFEDPRSKLFFEFVRLLKEARVKNPNVKFLLENVKMKKEYQDVISEYLGVEPIEINSALVSAQNRKRLYWTNLEGIEQPKDKGILLKDIVHKNCITDRGKSHCIISSIGRTTEREYFKKNQGQMVKQFNITPIEGQKVFIPLQNHSSKVGLICVGGVSSEGSNLWLDDGKLLQRNFSQGNRVYSTEGEGATLNANGGGIGGKSGLCEDQGYVRKLTPIECERLQTVPDNYTAHVSNSQRYKMLGNGWTVDIIVHILQSDISL